MNKNFKTIFTEDAPAPVGPYSQALRVGPWLICSGQIPLDPKTSQVVGSDISSQTHQVFKNIQACLEVAGASLNDVVKAGIFLTDLKEFSILNDIYSSYFKDHKPARSCVEVSALPKGVRIEIEIWAYCSDK